MESRARPLSFANKLKKSLPESDPYKLVPCRFFPSENAQPFTVTICLKALLVMDFHSHLSSSEVIGLVGGKYYHASRKLEVCSQFKILFALITASILWPNTLTRIISCVRIKSEASVYNTIFIQRFRTFLSSHLQCVDTRVCIGHAIFWEKPEVLTEEKRGNCFQVFPIFVLCFC